METDVRRLVREAIEESDRDKASAILLAWAEAHGYLRAINEALGPVLLEIGRDYESGKPVSLAHGYIAAKVTEDLLSRAMTAEGRNAAPTKGPVVIGNIEDDYHALGRKMVGAFLAAAGWKVRDLGNDVPASVFVDEAVGQGAKVIGVSAMMHLTALNILNVREEIDYRGLRGRIQLAVGGAIFVLRPELIQRVGGDGTAANGLLAPALFDDLWRRATLAEQSNERS
ncbi:MAG: Methylaspartate mutase S chain [candidate division BRC1 bacterium ADurb.BinA364]|nr:MAG: Methylaspartate mutase S chain [candidate division BRC1 bacterium ADurb.BinA364]